MASYRSIAKAGDFILNSPSLSKLVVPVANAFINLSGYRKIGLKYNDLISEENPVFQKALSRLPESEIYSRNFRILTAHQCALAHHLLPKNEQTKPEEDTNYIFPYLCEAEAELAEKSELDSIVVVSK